MSDFFEKLKKGMDVEMAVKKPAVARQKKNKEKVQEEKVQTDIEIKNRPILLAEEKKENWLEPEGQLTVDVFQTDKEIIIQSAVAGINPNELSISIDNDLLAIKGERGKLKQEKEVNYFYQECFWGKFSREIILPAEVDSSKARASMERGILTIRMPKIKKSAEGEI